MPKRVTKKQLQANRENARRSTGPRSPEGKARAARNALKHGLLARQVVIVGSDGAENPADFDALVADLCHELQPRGVVEEMLVARLAAAYWRLRRAHRFELGAIREALDDCGELPAGALPVPENLHVLLRYESMLDRQFHRILADLRQLRSQPAPSRPSPPSDLSHPSNPPQPPFPRDPQPDMLDSQSPASASPAPTPTCARIRNEPISGRAAPHFTASIRTTPSTNGSSYAKASLALPIRRGPSFAHRGGCGFSRPRGVVAGHPKLRHAPTRLASCAPDVLYWAQ